MSQGVPIPPGIFPSGNFSSLTADVAKTIDTTLIGSATGDLSFFGVEPVPQQEVITVTSKTTPTEISILQLLQTYGLTPQLSEATLVMSPLTGPPGTVITITGTSFLNVTSVTIGVLPMLIVSKTSTTLQVFVMPGNVTGIVQINSFGSYNTVLTPFTVTATGHPTAQVGSFYSAPSSTGIYQGTQSAISANNQKIFIGGKTQTGNFPAGWIWIKSGSIWVLQQTLSALGTIFTPPGMAGSLSGDATTIAIGATDNSTFGTYGRAYFYNNLPLLTGGTILTPDGYDGSFGKNVSISVDGNTAVFGDPNYTVNSVQIGQLFICSRLSNNQWGLSQPPLVTTNNVSNAANGWSVAISADGNTIISGGYLDNSNQGAAWIWNRNIQSGLWYQYAKLTDPSGFGATAVQGINVSINADGTTVAVNGTTYNTSQGATWIWTLSEGVWSIQQILTTTSFAYQGQFGGVSLSADGNTILIASTDLTQTYQRTLVWTRSGTTWTQQTTLISSPDFTGFNTAIYTTGVNLSPDGTIAVVGNMRANTNTGGFFIFQ